MITILLIIFQLIISEHVLLFDSINKLQIAMKSLEGYFYTFCIALYKVIVLTLNYIDIYKFYISNAQINNFNLSDYKYFT